MAAHKILLGTHNLDFYEKLTKLNFNSNTPRLYSQW